MTTDDARIEHLRFEHNLRVASTNLDLVGDILCAGEDAGCEECKRLLDIGTTETGNTSLPHSR